MLHTQQGVRRGSVEWWVCQLKRSERCPRFVRRIESSRLAPPSSGSGIINTRHSSSSLSRHALPFVEDGPREPHPSMLPLWMTHGARLQRHCAIEGLKDGVYHEGFGVRSYRDMEEQGRTHCSPSRQLLGKQSRMAPVCKRIRRHVREPCKSLWS